MTFKEVGIVVGVVVGVYIVGNCNGRSHVTDQQKVQAFKAANHAADSTERVWKPSVDSLRRASLRDSVSADSLRRFAQRLAGSHRTSGAPVPTPHPPGSGGATNPLPGNSPLSMPDISVAAYDSLAQAYDLMVRVDEANQRIIASKDSIIQQDSVMIAALQATRLAAREAVKAQTCTIVFGIKCPSRNTVALVALGAGLVGGFALGNH